MTFGNHWRQLSVKQRCPDYRGKNSQKSCLFENGSEYMKFGNHRTNITVRDDIERSILRRTSVRRNSSEIQDQIFHFNIHRVTKL